MKRHFYLFFLFNICCLAQENTNSNKNEELISYNKVDIIPIFENCKNLNKDLQKDCVVDFINTHIEKNLKYPEEAKKVNVESKVFCTFIIDEEGKITITEAKGKPTSFKKAFENEAIRVLNLLPKFIPAKHNNQIVKVQAQFTVDFKLENSSIIRENESVIDVPSSVTVTEPDYYDEPLPFAVVDQIPLFKSCESIQKKDHVRCFNEELKKHIEKTLKFPKKAKKEKIENNVSVVYQITENGEITNIHARARKPEHRLLFEEEAKRIISLIPNLIPGKQKGKAVKVNYATVIQFKL